MSLPIYETNQPIKAPNQACMGPIQVGHLLKA